MQNAYTLPASLPDLDNADTDDLEVLIARLQEQIRHGDEQLAELEKQVTANAMHIAGLEAEMLAWEQEHVSLDAVTGSHDEVVSSNVIPFPIPTSDA